MPENSDIKPGDEVDYTIRAVVLAVDESNIAFLNTGQAVHVDNLSKVDGQT